MAQGRPSRGHDLDAVLVEIAASNAKLDCLLLAKEIIEQSRHLERISREIGVPFVAIRGAHAEADIRSATEFIWSEINH